MLNSIGTNGCTTTHGGIVQASQTTATHHGIPMLQAGDGFACPVCKKWSTLITGSSTLSFSGIKAALDGDTFTCGAKLIASQSTAKVGAGGGSGSSAISSAIIQNLSKLAKPNPNQGLTNNLAGKDKYENYYAELSKTDVFIQHKAVLMPSEADGRKVAILQMASGAVSYFLNYRVNGNELFISVSINAHPLSSDATVYPFGNVEILRENETYGQAKLTAEPGFWNTSDNKAPLGSCTIVLPSPNLQVVTVKLVLGYRAKYNGTVGLVIPAPPTKSYTFSLSSFARKI